MRLVVGKVDLVRQEDFLLPGPKNTYTRPSWSLRNSAEKGSLPDVGW
jgi:hypothetical protein